MFIMTKNIISKETLAILKKRKGEGDSYSKLSIEFKIPAATLVYNLNEKYREKKKKKQREYQKRKYKSKKFTKEERAKRSELSKNYFKNRYQNDPVFRKAHIKRVTAYQKKMVVKK